MILADKYENAMEKLEMSFLQLNEQGSTQKDMQVEKLDKNLFDKTLKQLNVTLHQTV